MSTDSCDVLVIGGGPAGLRAAELTSGAGLRTVLADRMPSVGRKLLIAGRGGLNLTHTEPVESFIARYGDDARWRSLLSKATPDDLREWAHGLGVETFVGTSKRVFPTSKQAAPLLRRWVVRLKQQGVEFRTRHELRALNAEPNVQAVFATPGGETLINPRATVLALGGGSWPQTGSNAAWIALLREAGIEVAPLQAANCGYQVTWPASFLAEAEGQPLKNVVIRAGDNEVAGELLITHYGLEGGALYQVGRTLREMTAPALTIDLKPAFTAQQLAEKLNGAPGDYLKAATQAWKLSPVATALLRLCPVPTVNALAALAKSFPLALHGSRPLDEAISTAGGVAWSELNDDLMLRRLPGIFCAGEMIDWDAPTGGYLLQGCFATGTRAARGIISHLSRDDAARNLD